MIKIISAIAMIVIFNFQGSGQMRITSSEQAEELLRRGKTQQVTGIIISSVGFVGLVVGVNSFKQPELATLPDNMRATLITAAGLAASVVGIVNLTKGNKKIHKAKLFLNSEDLSLSSQSKTMERLVSVGVRFNF